MYAYRMYDLGLASAQTIANFISKKSGLRQEGY